MKQKTNKVNNKTSNKPKEKTGTDSEIACIDTCLRPLNSASIRCNMCMVWFHTTYVGINDVDGVGAWVCAGCRVMPETVKQMSSQINTLLETITILMKTYTNFSTKIDKKFERINDGITIELISPNFLINPWPKSVKISVV